MNAMNSNTLTTSSSVQHWLIDHDTQGQRLDNYLLSRLKGVPKTHVYKLIRKGEVRVNKKRAQADDRLHLGDVVRIPPVRVADKVPVASLSASMMAQLEQAVLYEDDVLLVLNKPAGWAVHGGSGIRLGVIEAVRQWRAHAQRWELVHRLDRDTSGCLLIAKKPSVLKVLQAQWNDFYKQYVALVAGEWSKRDVWVNAPLLKNVLQSGERMVQVSAQGKAALSEFSLVAHWQGVSQVMVRLHTGRTHQIRVHAQWKKHPLLGDDKYANAQSAQLSRQWGVRRLMLHAQRIEFTHPITQQRLCVDAPLADDMQQVMLQLSAHEQGIVNKKR